MTESSPGYARGRATKADIVDKAFHVFSESGYEGTSVREIARRCGINHATLLHHFPQKSLLLLAVLERRDEVQRIAPTSLDESLGLLLSIAERNEESPGLMRLFTVLAAEASRDGHPARSYFRARGDRLRGMLAGHVRDAQRAGTVDLAVDADVLATNLFALWEGLQLQAPLHPDLSVTGQLKAAFEQLAGHEVKPLP